jgi:hypothetical protein
MLLAGVACNNEDVPNEPQGKYPILFGNYETRATAGLDDLKENGFKVYAYFKGNTRNSHTFVKEVTYSDAQNVWGYEGLEYWIPGATYWFKALYPTMPLAGTLTVDNTSSTQSFTIADFDISKQEDIMVATAEREVADGAKFPTSGSSVVDLDFQHLLACVAIEVTSEVDNVLVKSLSLGGIDNMGDYDGTTWSADNTTSIDINSGITLDNSPEYTDLTNGGILVIPQEVKGIELVIVANKEYRVEIPADKTPAWNKGTKYTYKLTIKKNNITFVDNAPYTEEWDSESATGSVIIK